MRRRPPRSTRTDTLCPYTTLFRSPERGAAHVLRDVDGGEAKPRRVAQRFHGEDFLLVPARGVGRQLGLGEAARHVAYRLLLRAQLEIHPTPVFFIRPQLRAYALRREIGRAPSELQSLMRISYAVFCLKKKKYT